jgi:hypothetical protein
MSKYVRDAFSIKMRIGAKEILIGSGRVKCFLSLKENLNKSKCNLMKMNFTISKTKRTKIKIILAKKAFTIIIITILLLIMIN